jgi:hypothetical protein
MSWFKRSRDVQTKDHSQHATTKLWPPDSHPDAAINAREKKSVLGGKAASCSQVRCSDRSRERLALLSFPEAATSAVSSAELNMVQSGLSKYCSLLL